MENSLADATTAHFYKIAFKINFHKCYFCQLLES